MKQSGFMAKQAAQTQSVMEATERITRQLMLDCIQVVLHNEEHMGYDRIKRLSDKLLEVYSEYHDALNGGMEADYWQEHLDREIADIMKGRPMMPFAERYPEVRDCNEKYLGRRKR